MECDSISNSTCSFICSESYQTPTLDNFMNCMFVEYECAELPPPDALNNATCRDPTNYIADYDRNLLNGDWYTVQGFNPVYDCLQPCAIQTYEIEADGTATYDAVFNMDDINGDEIWRTNDMVGENTSIPGVLSFSGFQHGLPDAEHWYVMHLTEDSAVMYYCGSVMTWTFEGLIVLSRTPTLNPEREADVAAVLASLEIDQADMCMLNPGTDCAGAPTTPSEFIM